MIADTPWFDRDASAIHATATISQDDWIPCRRPAASLGEHATITNFDRPGATQVAAWQQRALPEERLFQLLRLRPNWDSYGARPVERSAALLARLFLASLPGRIAPSIVPTIVGGVQIEWHAGDLDIEIECFPDGTAQLFASDGSVEEERWVNPWHPAIREWLAKLSPANP